MDVEERVNLVTKNTAEVITKEELLNLLETKERPRVYVGYEISGFVHIGMGLISIRKLRDFIEAGLETIVFLADWHSFINNKLGGNMENIRKAGEYFIHCFKALGVEPGKAKFIWASDLVKDPSYWEKVIRIAKKVSLNRVKRALPIMGRSMDLEDMEAAWLFYPAMQCADIFHMELDIACGGMDQRKAHMLARDVAEKLGWKKPIAIHTPLLIGLEGAKKRMGFSEDLRLSSVIASKMSKSKPENCIFIHDTPDQIRNKIRKAYCPPRETENNPILEIAKHIIFPEMGSLTVKRKPEHGGDVTYNSFSELEKAYAKGELHPLDLKNAVADALVEILKPVREYFKRNPTPLKIMAEIQVSR